MNSLALHLRGTSIAAALAILASFEPAKAAEPPANIAEVMADAVEACKNAGGKADTSAILKSDDINGDAGKDWIADFSKLKCEGSANPVCSEAGCTLQLYFWVEGDTWDLVFEDFVRAYKFSTSGKDRTMHVTTSGLPCNKEVTETCTYTYRLDRDAVTPLQ